MSSTDTFTKYDFYFTNQPSVGGGTMNEFGFEVVSRGEFTDAMAFALCDAWKGLAWPTGETVDAQVSKQDVTDVAYTTNYTATPPSFT